MFTVGYASVTDAGTIEMIEKECFSRPWSYNDILAGIGRDDTTFLVCREGGDIAGYIGAYTAADEMYVNNVAVRSAFRRRGAGDMLVRSLAEEARGKGCAFISLEVRTSNGPAVKLYEKHGFVLSGTRRGFYRDPDEDAYIMTLYLKENNG